MSTLGDRVKAERETKGWTQAELARRVVRAGYKSMSQPGIFKIENKGNSEPKSITALAKALGVTPEWLETGRGEKSALRKFAVVSGMQVAADAAKGPGRREISSEVRINELDVHVAAGMGGDGETAILASEEAGAILGAFAFPRASFREMVPGPAEGVRVIAVRGDSMQPTLWPGQRVMVDVNDKTPSPPGIFVVWDGLALVLKRIELVAGSDPMRVRIMSDNPKYTAYERTLDEAHINGRVVGVWARM